MVHVRSALLVLAPLSLAMIGCSSAADTGATAGGGGTAGGPDAGAPAATITASIGPINADPGTERTQCITLHLDNAEGAFARRFRTTLEPGSHHMIVYKSNETTESTTPTDCKPFAGLLGGDHPIFIAQQAKSELDFPADDHGTPVGLPIDPGQMVRIELHYINTTNAPIAVHGTIDIDTVPLGTDIVKSDIAFWGTKQIDIPPNASWDSGVHFSPGLSGTKTFALTTHQHHLGTEMLVWYASSATDPAMQKVADGTNWSDPPLQLFSTPLDFPDSGSMLSTRGFAYQCKWNNPTPDAVTFGESANDEMCFLWHYYFPAQGFQVCVDSLCQVK